ncbi:MurT ligase domain-containing protein [Nonomuraea sp. NPDC049129]|uniref:Mur ligase family protein n=1 Tax=Nonomuraea sp. NPDC049129 TaxID=3155272 RepID=UPI0033CBE407
MTFIYQKMAWTGAGTVLGRVALKLAPNVLRELSEPLEVILISGTNGKTTTTRFVTEIMTAVGDAVSNGSGANMPAGIVSALATASSAQFGVLEVDERYLARLCADTKPRVVVLLNLSRDQLDRNPEPFLIAKQWRDTLMDLKGVIVVANCNDPLVYWAASAAPEVTWVAAESVWSGDSYWCPSCEGNLRHAARGMWCCGNCGLRRPEPDWCLGGDQLVAPLMRKNVTIDVALPGRINVSNAAMAMTTCATLGVPPEVAVEYVKRVQSVAGRYQVVPIRDREVRLLLAKNPASWAEVFPVLDESSSVLIILNARTLDGRDTSWIWDVDFRALTGRRVFVAGDRRLDLALRLDIAGVTFTIVSSLHEASALVPTTRLDIVANYTGFLDLVKELRPEVIHG